MGLLVSNVSVTVTKGFRESAFKKKVCFGFTVLEASVPALCACVREHSGQGAHGGTKLLAPWLGCKKGGEEARLAENSNESH